MHQSQIGQDKQTASSQTSSIDFIENWAIRVEIWCENCFSIKSHDENLSLADWWKWKAWNRLFEAHTVEGRGECWAQEDNSKARYGDGISF